MSKINACQYCHGVHSNAAIGLGLASDAVTAICELPAAPDNPKLVSVLAYVAKLTSEPASIDKADVNRMLDAGWDETAVSFAAFVAALYAFMNRLIEGHGIKASDEYLKSGGTRIAEIGYAGLAEMLAGQS